VGKAGTTSLIISQKLGALGPALHGRKVAIWRPVRRTRCFGTHL